MIQKLFLLNKAIYTCACLPWQNTLRSIVDLAKKNHHMCFYIIWLLITYFCFQSLLREFFGFCNTLEPWLQLMCTYHKFYHHLSLESSSKGVCKNYKLLFFKIYVFKWNLKIQLDNFTKNIIILIWTDFTKSLHPMIT